MENIDPIIKTAEELIAKTREFSNQDNITQFTVMVRNTRFRFNKNKVKSAPFVGWFTVLSTSVGESDFADSVCLEVNKRLKQEGMHNSGTKMGTLGEALSKEETKKTNSELVTKNNKVASKTKNNNSTTLFFSPPKSNIEDMFNSMHKDYVEGMTNRIRLYTRFGYVVFDSICVAAEEPDSTCEDLQEIVTALSDLWRENKPEKSVYTRYELFREFGLA